MEVKGRLKVIITGGAGFIGSATSELSANKGHTVTIVDNLYSSHIDNIRHLLSREGVRFVKVDIRRMRELEEGLRGELKDVSAIVHLAAIINVLEVMERPKEAFEVNVAGTLNVLELARKHDIERVVFASSVAVYGEPQRIPIDESHPKRPKNLYGLTKLFSEELLWRYMEDYGLKPIALRYFNVYGPRMRAGPYAGVIYNFISYLLRGERPVIYGDGEQTRDFVFVYDVAEANLKAIESDFVGAVNIGSGAEVSINDLFNKISRIIGVSVRPRREPPRPGDVRRSRADVRLAERVLNWVPRVQLDEGLRRTVEYYRSKLRYKARY